MAGHSFSATKEVNHPDYGVNEVVHMKDEDLVFQFNTVLPALAPKTNEENILGPTSLDFKGPRLYSFSYFYIHHPKTFYRSPENCICSPLFKALCETTQF